MKTLAILASMLVLLGYLALMRVDPGWGLLHPRGDLVALAVSLAIANVGVWLATQPHRPSGTRFQLAAAGRVWIAAQGGGLACLYAKSGAS